MNNEIFEKIQEIAGSGNVRRDEIMAPHMSMKVGGPADCFVEACDTDTLAALIKYLNEETIEYYVLGNGSNCIIRDEGYRGVIICTKDKMTGVSVCGERITAQAGIGLKELAEAAFDASLTGLEFASGIPGSLGGAVTMNAGAYDGEMKNVIETVTVIDRAGNIVELKNEECDFAYRHSTFSAGDYVVISAQLKLQKGSQSEIRERMDDLEGRRAAKQPLEVPSCGSTLKGLKDIMPASS